MYEYNLKNYGNNLKKKQGEDQKLEMILFYHKNYKLDNLD